MPDFAMLDLFKTKNELVYDYLRMNILEKRFKPGDKIIIWEISKSLNVSDIPIREAIQKFENQGLLGEQASEVVFRIKKISEE